MKFKLESHPSCGYDYVELLDGHESNSHVLGKFCGDDKPPKLTASGNRMSVKFHSDVSKEYRGFMLNYMRSKKNLIYLNKRNIIEKI